MKFAIEIVRFCRSLPRDWEARELAKQLLRWGTAVAANYRASGRARSDKEFCSKIGVVLEEADEAQLWLELIPEAYPVVDAAVHGPLHAEATELTAIFTASYKTARTNLLRKKGERKTGRAK